MVERGSLFYIKKKRGKFFYVFFLNFQREVLKASGYHNTIGNRMKQKKLYEEFPAVDSSVLDEIFQANWFVNSVFSPNYFFIHVNLLLFCNLKELLIHVCLMMNNFSRFYLH